MNKISLNKKQILLATFLAGFSFISLEVSWFRMLSLVSGATIASGTIVLSGFMFGQGLGAYFFGKSNSNIEKLKRTLAALLIALSVFAVYSYTLFSNHIFALSETTSVAIFKFIAGICVFLPALAMGALLPIVSRLYISTNEEVKQNIGKLYSIETLGSTFGGLATGLFVIAKIGQKNAIYFAALFLLISAVILLFTKVIQTESGDNATSSQHPRIKMTFEIKVLFATTFLIGFAIMALQIIWIKFFKVYFTNVSYTFSLITSSVIVGLFVGSRIFQKRSLQNKVGSKDLSNVLILLISVIVAGLIILVKLPEWLLFPFESMQDFHWFRLIITPLVSVILIVIPASVVSGYTFPLICYLYNNTENSINKSVAKVMLFNSLGSALGPLATLFVFLPIFKTSLSVFVLTLILSVLGIIYLQKVKSKNKNIFFHSVLAISLLLLIFQPKMQVLPPSFHKFDRKILSYTENVEGVCVVGEEQQGRQKLLSTYVNNNAVIGSSYDAIKAVKMVGHLPFLYGLECKNVLVVGFGIGVTTSAIASHNEVQSIHCVELMDKGLKKSAKYYSGLNNNILNDKRLKITQGDGRFYLQTSKDKYDLISSDPTHPILGSANLYTKEYFQLCYDHLSDSGMVSQYLPLHKLLAEDLMGIIKTFNSVFPNTLLWLGHNHGILLGVKYNSKIDFEKWNDNVSKLQKDIYFYNNPYHLAACLVLDSEAISSLDESVKINTDNRCYSEFFKFSSLNASNLPENITLLNNMRINPEKVFYNIPDSLMFGRFVEGNKLLTEGLSLLHNRNALGYKQFLIKANQANPENEEYPFLFKYYFE